MGETRKTNLEIQGLWAMYRTNYEDAKHNIFL